ncbi:MAG: hypothetical protein U0457_21040 [Candidatus Sericytochromatia bacterium]
MNKIILMSFLLITSCSNIDISKIQDNKKNSINKVSDIPEFNEVSSKTDIIIDSSKIAEAPKKVIKDYKIEKFEGKLVFASNDKAENVESNTLYFLDGANPIPLKIINMIENETETQKTEVSNYQISPDESKIFIQKNTINKKDNAILKKYFYIFDIKDKSFKSLNIEQYITSIKWFSNGNFLSLFSNDKNINKYKIIIFDIDKNASTFEYNLDDKTYGYFILPEIKLRKNSDFTYFLLGPFYNKDNLVRHKLFKIYKNNIEIVNEIVDFNLASNNNIFNDELLIYLNIGNYKRELSTLNINSLNKKVFFYYEDIKELKNFYSSKIIRNIEVNNKILVSGNEYSDFNTTKTYKLFLFDIETKDLINIDENKYSNYYITLLSKNILLYDSNANYNIINLEKLTYNTNLSIFFTNNLSYKNIISSIYSD